MVRKIKFSIALVLVCAMFLFPGIASAEKVIQWDMATPWASTNFQSVCAQIFADEVEKATDGRLVINIHFGGSLGYAGPELLMAVREGLVPIASVLKNAQTGEEQIFGAESLPFLAPGLPQLRMLQFFMEPIEEKFVKKHNQKTLYTVPWPSRNIFTKKEIKTLEDLKNLKIRTVSREDSQFLDALGAQPIQMPWGEVVPSLATGVIDGVGTSNASGVDGKFWEFLSYALKLDWQCSTDMINVNLDAWNKLPEDIRTIVEEKARELEPRFWQIAAETNREHAKILTENGVKITEPGPELRKEIIAAASPIWKEFMENVPEAKGAIEGYLSVMDIDY